MLTRPVRSALEVQRYRVSYVNWTRNIDDVRRREIAHSSGIAMERSSGYDSNLRRLRSRLDLLKILEPQNGSPATVHWALTLPIELRL